MGEGAVLVGTAASVGGTAASIYRGCPWSSRAVASGGGMPTPAIAGCGRSAFARVSEGPITAAGIARCVGGRARGVGMGAAHRAGSVKLISVGCAGQTSTALCASRCAARAAHTTVWETHCAGVVARIGGACCAARGALATSTNLAAISHVAVQMGGAVAEPVAACFRVIPCGSRSVGVNLSAGHDPHAACCAPPASDASAEPTHAHRTQKGL
jgi:hypothetical protein